MLELRSCPRCKGDLHTNKDYYGEYRLCLQCGYMRDVTPSEDPYAAAIAKTKDPKAA